MSNDEYVEGDRVLENAADEQHKPRMQSSQSTHSQECTSFPLNTSQCHLRSLSSMYDQIGPYERIHHNVASISRCGCSKESDSCS